MQAVEPLAALDVVSRGVDLRHRLPARVLSKDPRCVLFFRGDLISDEGLMEGLLRAVQGENSLEGAMGVYAKSSRSESWLIPAASGARVASLNSLRRHWISAWPSYCSDHCVVADTSKSWMIYFDPLEDFGLVALYETGDSMQRRVDQLRDSGCFSVEEVGAHLSGSVISINLRGLQESFLTQLKDSYAAG